jgi:hypothetical protein
MKTTLMLAACLVAVSVGQVRAQDVIMNSAETINKGNFKFSGFPIIELGDGDNETGFGARAGYGFGRGFDIEAKISKFDGLTYYGVDAEWWLHRADPDFSVALGVHRSTFDDDEFDIMGIDATALVSKKIATNLEGYLGFRVAFEMPDEPFDDFRRMHLVPGIEYRISDDLDFLAEFGLKLNDDSSSYASIGLAYYIR